MRITHSSRSPASSDSLRSPTRTARDPSRTRGRTPKTRSTAATKSAAVSMMVLMLIPPFDRTGSAAQTDTRAKPVRPGNGTASGASSPEPLRHGVELERALQRMADSEERVLRELLPDQLQADGEPFRQPARNREPRQSGHVRRDREHVREVHR